MKMETIGVKNFGGKVDITDPCYNRDVWCRMNDVRIKEGEYTCGVWWKRRRYTVAGKAHYYKIVGAIGIYLDGIIPEHSLMQYVGDIGVDAGLAGFFHDKPDFTDAQWNAFCSQIAKGVVWLTDIGFFSMSGDGDGEYEVFAARDGSEATALEIRFA